MKTGQIYYPTGELYFIGRYDENTIREDGIPYRLYAGVQFYRNGNVHMEGVFQWGGLFYGRLFYPSGKLKFIGQFNEKHGEITGVQPEDYYGPTYPLEGIYYSENGEILYQGKFTICKRGNAGWPVVVEPEGFGAFA